VTDAGTALRPICYIISNVYEIGLSGLTLTEQCRQSADTLFADRQVEQRRILVRSRELLCSSSHGLHCGVRPLTLAVCAASQLIVRHWFVERQTSKLNHTILPRNVVLEDSAAAMAGLRSGTSLRSGRDFSRSGCTRLHYVFRGNATNNSLVCCTSSLSLHATKTPWSTIF
jgi:hypothetical protein